MHTWPWLTILLLVPTVGALLVAAVPRRRALLAKQLALGISLVELVLTIIMSVVFTQGKDGFQFVQSYSWIKAFGTSYQVGVDGISLVLIALSAVLVPVVILASWDDAETFPGVEAASRRSVPMFFALILILQASMVGVFAATDVFLFYVFFEAMLIPMYFLIGSYGAPGPKRSYAAVKFLLYSLLGGLLMLAAVIALFVLSSQQLHHGTFDFDTLRHINITPTEQKLMFLAFFVAFAIKAPLFPFHTWLPDAGAEAPTGGAVLLVGVLDKVGTFGLIRYCIPLFPDASKSLAWLVLALAVIGIFYGALLAVGQRDLMRLVAYTSVAHFGFIAIGIFAFTTQGGTGAVFYMVNHGLSTGALFLVVGFMIARRGSRDPASFGGWATRTPLLAGTFLIVGMSSLALPGLSTFVSEFLVLVGTFTQHRALAIVATVGIVLAALYILLMYQRTMHGPLREGTDHSMLRDLNAREMFVIAPMIALIVALGVYPKPLLDTITPAVKATFSTTGHADPVPPHPIQAETQGASR
jgi:NADH-quinone oxidoreductase subunit M